MIYGPLATAVGQLVRMACSASIGSAPGHSLLALFCNMSQGTGNIDELLRLLFDCSKEHALILLDPSGQIIGWFRGAEITFGYTADEVLGKDVSMLFTADNLAAGMDRYEQEVAKTGMEAEDDRWMLRKDGARFWAAGVLSPIHNEAGTLVGFGKVIRDRTDMRAKTEVLEKQHLEMIERDRRKDTFISTLSHELRNPLASLTNAMHLLEVGADDAESISIVRQTLAHELAAMGRMIDDLLDVTRVSAGKVQLQRARIDVRKIVSSAVDVCRPKADERNLKLHVLMSESPMMVDADEVRMRQVIVNLLQNAVKFSRDRGTIWVKVSLEANEAVVKVEDNGLGIAPDALPNIFDLFTQAGAESRHTNVGLGIGLSVVKDLTTLHGGSVQVRSDGLGKGSEFTVRLPLAPGEERPDSPG
jgi:PAS domain S-box-containing protein